MPGLTSSQAKGKIVKQTKKLVENSGANDDHAPGPQVCFVFNPFGIVA